MTGFAASIRPALVMTLVFTALTGLLYPLAVTGAGQALFPEQANGSLIRDHGRVVGSSLVGQGFAGDRYFHGRPSAAGKGYDGLSSAGSNLAPGSKDLAERIATDIATQRAAGVVDVPADLVTTSGSGLDPDISPAGAAAQVDRIAQARSIGAKVVREVVAREAKAPVLGLFGEPRVNVLALNRQLDALSATPVR